MSYALPFQRIFLSDISVCRRHNTVAGAVASRYDFFGTVLFTMSGVASE